MAYKQVLLGDFFKFEKGLGYKGEFLAEDSDVALIGMDSHEEGGGYKEGSEKPYSGPYKEIHVSNPGDVIFAATDLTQDGHVLGSPLLVPDSDEFQTFIYSHHLLKAFQIKEGFLPEYLYNIYRCEKYRLKAAYADSGTTVRALPSDVLEEQIVPLPDLPTQEAINEVISLIDQQIANNKSLAKNLELLAQSIFKSWFIDFDPVHAKSRGEKPFGMDDGTAALFPDSFEESELGMIPKGWSVGKFGDYNNLLMGQSPPGESYNNEGLGLPFYQGRTDFGIRFPERRIYCTIEKRVANPRETLVSVRAPVGDINQAIEKCVIGRGIAAVMHKSNSPIYTYSLLSSLKSRLSYFNGEGSVFGAINKSDFENLKILEPSNALIKKFDQLLGSTNLLIHELHQSSKSLVSLRVSLLPKLISGELQIPEELLVS